MPAHASDACAAVNPDDISVSGVACPRPLTPPLETDGDSRQDCDPAHPYFNELGMTPPASDNTATGMSMRQEDSMYSNPESPRAHGLPDGENEKTDALTAEDRSEALSKQDGDISPITDATQVLDTPLTRDEPSQLRDPKSVVEGPPQDCRMNTQLRTPTPTPSPAPSDPSQASAAPTRRLAPASGIPAVDRALSHTPEAKLWEFSKRTLRNQYPSALFQTNSRYTGFQQSDRQIYNVEVTILTVDMDQCTTSGYLQICGLTPDHPTLTTFFTGEIIGGPDQKFSFRTKNTEWGATDRTDMTHWARFPAWRSLSSQAKQDLNFVHPSDQSSWWQQENIFMRWKEHFLVPDYKLRSIQGASFEGFYYICLNQIEGKISGIYFHSKSEKYQQLELKHDGKPQVWSRGVCPSVEFR